MQLNVFCKTTCHGNKQILYCMHSEHLRPFRTELSIEFLGGGNSRKFTEVGEDVPNATYDRAPNGKTTKVAYSVVFCAFTPTTSRPTSTV